MPRVETVESLKEATAATVEAAAEGLLSAQEGEAMARIVEADAHVEILIFIILVIVTQAEPVTKRP